MNRKMKLRLEKEKEKYIIEKYVPMIYKSLDTSKYLVCGAKINETRSPIFLRQP